MYSLEDLGRETGLSRRTIERLVAEGAVPRPAGYPGLNGKHWGPEHLAALRSFVALGGGRRHRDRDGRIRPTRRNFARRQARAYARLAG